MLIGMPNKSTISYNCTFSEWSSMGVGMYVHETQWVGISLWIGIYRTPKDTYASLKVRTNNQHILNKIMPTQFCKNNK